MKSEEWNAELERINEDAFRLGTNLISKIPEPRRSRILASRKAWRLKQVESVIT